ncbi:hypothetical protein [Candidatus Mycolicibacterium alkanivorans]|uniref:Uncharacterized protein n=1 Tax=Candidatus Mycolicibacterium alkanivorans TaxID=2954114 RepID=A0ABS9YTY7_9MYCO|nr:hypothetical protein [Candidatus Mycolicibacterium alkanivorans]MCI4674268.1 hypothetical protein [Candidatus Mycolicibacterium alkanivorans]
MPWEQLPLIGGWLRSTRVEATRAGIARIDLIGLAEVVIDGVDLPAIIRESTGTVTAEVMTDVRTQTARADDVVSGFVDRMLGRTPRPQDPE